jgi:hypothetical protein
MSYVDANLISGETIVFRTHLHWKVFLPSVLLFVVGIAFTAGAIYQGFDPYLSFLILVIPLGVLFYSYLTMLGVCGHRQTRIDQNRHYESAHLGNHTHKS